MKNTYAGVTLDWYDDNLATLKAKFPAAHQLPDIIKEADVRPSHQVPNEQFALVALNNGYVLRKYACHDPGTTAMSVIYFMEHGDKLPDEAQKVAAANLHNACVEHDLTPPASLTKVASLAGLGIGALGGAGIGALAAGEGKRLKGALIGGGLGAAGGAGLGHLGARRAAAATAKTPAKAAIGLRPPPTAAQTETMATRAAGMGDRAATARATRAADMGAFRNLEKPVTKLRLSKTSAVVVLEKLGLMNVGLAKLAGLMGQEPVPEPSKKKLGAQMNMEKTSWGGGKQHAENLQRILKDNPGIAMSEAVKKYNMKYKKASAVIDITGKRPAPKVKLARPQRDEDYAVVLQDGSRHYPIDTWDRVKLAEDYYQENRLRMEPRVRRQFAVKLASRALHFGYPLDYEIFEKGACTYARPGEMKAAIEMRKVACAPGEAREWLDELFEKRAHIDAPTYAACLHRFDVENGLDRGWDHLVLDPWESTFGINKTAEVVWEHGADRVTDDQLQNLAQNQHSGMDELFTHEVSKEFIKDPVGIFNSMPDPQKKIIARLANDMTSQGGSEVAVVG